MPLLGPDCRSYQGWKARCELLEGSRRPGHTQQVGQGGGWVPSAPATLLRKGTTAWNIPHASIKGTELSSLDVSPVSRGSHCSRTFSLLSQPQSLLLSVQSRSLTEVPLPAPKDSCSTLPLHQLGVPSRARLFPLLYPSSRRPFLPLLLPLSPSEPSPCGLPLPHSASSPPGIRTLMRAETAPAEVDAPRLQHADQTVPAWRGVRSLGVGPTCLHFEQALDSDDPDPGASKCLAQP